MSLFVVLRNLWFRLPEGVRCRINGNRIGRFVKEYANTATTRHCATHDELYDDAYYARIDSAGRHSAVTIARTIIVTWHPGSVVDVGCGTGRVMAALREEGVTRVVGLDRAKAALAHCHARGLNARLFDLSARHVPDVGRFDVAISLEVAEHLEAAHAGRYVTLLCRLAPRVVITAAGPGQEGTDHRNLQPLDYWVTRFAENGYVLQAHLVERWRAEWRAAVVTKYYWSNLLVFEQRS